MNKRILLIGGLAGIVGVTAGLLGADLLRTVSAQGLPVAAAETGRPVATTATLGQSLVVVAPVHAQPVREMLRINGKLALNAMRLQQISSRVAGRVEKIMLFEGAAVRAGAPIALLYSPEYVSAQNEFILARNTVRMLSGKATADLLEDARVTLDSARNRLKVLGVSESEVAALEQSGSIQQHLVIRAPISGRLIKRNVDPGGYLETGASLGTVADLSSLWFLGNAYEADFARLQEGQPVDLTVTGLQGQPLRGRIGFISPIVDPQTHTASVRVDLANRDGRLKPDMFARADVVLERRMLPVVPRAAVVQDGAESFVIVQREPDRYERVPVQVFPAGDDDHLAVTRGVKEGDRVVLEGGVLVDGNLTNPPAEKVPSTPAGVRGGAGR